MKKKTRSRTGSKGGARPAAANAQAAVALRDGEVVLYGAPGGGAALEVRLKKETVWLSQRQMADLFGKDTDTVGLHIRNLFKEGELVEETTAEESSVVQREGGRTVQRSVKLYNLDVIISVGYRIKSKRGTLFRIWATKVLRDHIIKGFTANTRRLKELNHTIRIVAGVAEHRALTGDDATALLRMLADYSYALDLLDDYDHQRVTIRDTTKAEVTPVTYDESRRLVARLRQQFGGSDLFGREKDDGLPGSLAAILQTAGGEEVYPTLEEKAANLLYFLVKNHHFVDGNKRIAAALLLWFLEKNGALYRGDGSKRIADNALVAMTLLIAESSPRDKEILTRIVVNLINKKV